MKDTFDANKKKRKKMARWQQVEQNEWKKLAELKRKANFEDRRFLLEENQMGQIIITEEKWIMMIDPNRMDHKVMAYW
jgi:hypothetical protein